MADPHSKIPEWPAVMFGLPPIVPLVDCDLVGIVEIAERLGVQRATVDKWRTRGLLPEPWQVISGTPIWDWPVIERWAERTRRA